MQYVQCPTRGKSRLDQVHRNMKQTYRTTPLPHLCLSDHISLLIILAYKPPKRTKPARRTVKTWPEGALSQLQDCFSNTEWFVFGHLELSEYSEMVFFYIKACTDNVTVDKQVRIYNNQKPERRGVKAAKMDCKRKVENHLAVQQPEAVVEGFTASHKRAIQEEPVLQEHKKNLRDKNFLMQRPQTVRVGPLRSSTLTLSTGSPQGCVGNSLG